MKRFRALFLVTLFFSFWLTAHAQINAVTNPIIKGYYADPTIIKDKGLFYIYATIDPWGGKELGVLVTSDFVTFKTEHINWPTKQVCTSPTSNNSMV